MGGLFDDIQWFWGSHLCVGGAVVSALLCLVLYVVCVCWGGLGGDGANVCEERCVSAVRGGC